MKAITSLFIALSLLVSACGGSDDVKPEVNSAHEEIMKENGLQYNFPDSYKNIYGTWKHVSRVTGSGKKDISNGTIVIKMDGKRTIQDNSNYKEGGLKTLNYLLTYQPESDNVFWIELDSSNPSGFRNADFSGYTVKDQILYIQTDDNTFDLFQK